MTRREEINRLRQAGRKKDSLEKIEAWYGKKCANCGSEEDVEYHHIVPLYVGGTNEITNMVPLCRSCHYAVHHGVRLDCSELKHISGGRKRKAPSEEAVRAFTDYVNCKIPRCEAVRIMKQKPNWTRVWWQKEICEEMNIVEFHNNIGVKLAKTGLLPMGYPAGWVKTKQGDGRVVKTRIDAYRDFTAKEYGIKKADFIEDNRVEMPIRMPKNWFTNAVLSCMESN